MTDIHVTPQYNDHALDREFRRIGSFAFYKCRIIQETETTVRLEWRYPFQSGHLHNHIEWYARDMVEIR